jgi:hypothetical protein
MATVVVAIAPASWKTHQRVTNTLEHCACRFWITHTIKVKYNGVIVLLLDNDLGMKINRHAEGDYIGSFGLLVFVVVNGGLTVIKPKGSPEIGPKNKKQRMKI